MGSQTGCSDRIILKSAGCKPIVVLCRAALFFGQCCFMVLRVIAGEFRRRHLKTPPGIGTRPYTDRVRQMVFDRLRDDLEKSRVADVYSGVGTMGLESLSRGAASCVFFEGDPEVHGYLKLNVATIAPTARTICWRTDVRRTSFRPNGGEDCLPYTLIFFDPPYADVPQLLEGKPLAASLKRLARPEISTDNARLILRTPQYTDFEPVGGWVVEERWDISTMIVWKLCKTDAYVEATENDYEEDDLERDRYADDESDDDEYEDDESEDEDSGLEDPDDDVADDED
jgi:16S rRNA (guanine966-N2)-methyltransferase